MPRCSMAGEWRCIETRAVDPNAQDLPFVGRPVSNDDFDPLTVDYWRQRVLRRVLPNAIVLAATALITAIYLLWLLCTCCCRCCCARKPKARCTWPLLPHTPPQGPRKRARRALRAAVAVVCLGVVASCLYGAILADPRVVQTAEALLGTIQVSRRLCVAGCVLATKHTPTGVYHWRC